MLWWKHRSSKNGKGSAKPAGDLPRFAPNQYRITRGAARRPFSSRVKVH
jgi:hypothetical protein